MSTKSTRRLPTDTAESHRELYELITDYLEYRDTHPSIAIAVLVHLATAIAADISATKVQMNYVCEAMHDELDRAFAKCGKARAPVEGRVRFMERLRHRVVMRFGLRWKT